MSAELDLLELDVVEARCRVKDDLANLRAPGVANLKRDLKRDLTSSADDVLTNIKDRLTANPVATLAIGAGLAWRFVHRPPVASLLVGYGLYSLMRTDPSRPSAMSAYATQAVEAGAALADRVTRAAGDAQSAAADKLGAVREAAAQTAQAVNANASQWADRAAQTASGTAEAVMQGATSARESVYRGAQAVQEAAHRDKDTYLLGFAAAALAAAIGISAQRRARAG
jgi:gas vesicle protein